MPPRMPFTRSPVVLLANSGTWLNQALDSVLEPLGYRVVSVGSGRELLDRAPAARPDVILMDANRQALDSLAVCRAPRQNRAVPWHTPIFMITSTPATKQQRLAALEAGAWDYLSLVLNAEELALKLDAFTRIKLETDRALDQGAVEPASGLYTMHGLERRARELVSDAFRRCWSGPATRPSRTCTRRRSPPTASWNTPERRWSRLAPRETVSVSEPTRGRLPAS